jgi:hypothetical protein
MPQVTKKSGTGRTHPCSYDQEFETDIDLKVGDCKGGADIAPPITRNLAGAPNRPQATAPALRVRPKEAANCGPALIPVSIKIKRNSKSYLYNHCALF